MSLYFSFTNKILHKTPHNRRIHYNWLTLSKNASEQTYECWSVGYFWLNERLWPSLILRVKSRTETQLIVLEIQQFFSSLPRHPSLTEGYIMSSSKSKHASLHGKLFMEKWASTEWHEMFRSLDAIEINICQSLAMAFKNKLHFTLHGVIKITSQPTYYQSSKTNKCTAYLPRPFLRFYHCW